MKALTIRQPWASLIMAGTKRVENRTWSTNYRGPLVIHAAAAPAPKAQWDDVSVILEAIGGDPETVPYCIDPKRAEYGVALGTVELVDVVSGLDDPFAMEYCFQWVLDNPVLFDHPAPVKGKLGLWDWEA